MFFFSVLHYVENVCIQSSGPYFPAFGMNTDIRSISSYSVRMRENTDHKNSKYGPFSRSTTSYQVFKIITIPINYCT